MGRSHMAWLVGLPLLAAAWLSAHGLAYELVPATGETPHATMAARGHGYLEDAPLVVAVLLVLAAAALLARGLERRPPGRTLPAWLFGIVPLLGFAVQEHLERLFHGGEALWATAAEPVFLLGILLQLPFGLAAALVARTLHGAAETLAAEPERRRPRRALVLQALPRAADLVPVPVLAHRQAGRAPPALR
jgi:hypothetical protein